MNNCPTINLSNHLTTGRLSTCTIIWLQADYQPVQSFDYRQTINLSNHLTTGRLSTCPIIGLQADYQPVQSLDNRQTINLSNHLTTGRLSTCPIIWLQADYQPVQSFDYRHTSRWRLFLKRAAHTTIDIYDFIISIESDVKQQNLIFLWRVSQYLPFLNFLPVF